MEPRRFLGKTAGVGKLEVAECSELKIQLSCRNIVGFLSNFISWLEYYYFEKNQDSCYSGPVWHL